MLRITISSDASSLCCRLEGRIVGPWAEELEKVWESLTARRRGKSCLVDLSGVSFVDEAGQKALARCYADGAEFKASGPLTRYIVDNLTRPPDQQAKKGRGAAQGKS